MGPSLVQVSLRLDAWKFKTTTGKWPGSEVRFPRWTTAMLMTRDEDRSRAQKRERRRKAGGGRQKRERRELDYRSVGTRRLDRWLPQATELQKTGCLRRNRLCVEKSNDSNWQVSSRASHERAERGHGLGPADPGQFVRGLGLFHRARVP